MISTGSTLQDAGALLALLEHSTWNELYVNCEAMEIYISRSANGCNPMRSATSQAIPAVPQVDGELSTVTAAHLGTFRPGVSAGETVEAGTELGWLEVLDERRPILSVGSGRVIGVLAETGSLVEHRQALFEVERF